MLGVAVAVVVVAIGLNVLGVLRYPGGPLRDSSDNWWFWIDGRDADAGNDVEGNIPVDWARTDTDLYFGDIYLPNPWPWPATVDAITPIDPTPGFSIVATYLVPAEADQVGYGPLTSVPGSSVRSGWTTLPAAVSPSVTADESRAGLLIRATTPGDFGFRDLAVDYRVGPFSFRALQHITLEGCLGPLPDGMTCRKF
jgi:hypothetical protein